MFLKLYIEKCVIWNAEKFKENRTSYMSILLRTLQALYGKEAIEGTIVREYGLGNEILNIDFNNGTKHTAIGRRAILAILG
ncbi:hypothetical protein [Clostridium magnum]|uniref:hypothetical protein n=1 Tax=Clostridium magnum TaxID=33954 RepID=UPI000934D4DB|nr:hypothetical protein [Clostridium magnum]